MVVYFSQERVSKSLEKTLVTGLIREKLYRALSILAEPYVFSLYAQ